MNFRLVQQALAALEMYREHTPEGNGVAEQAIEALARTVMLDQTYHDAQRKPLTDAEIWRTYKNLWMFHPAEEPRLAGDILKFARAIEAAHGIKGPTS